MESITQLYPHSSLYLQTPRNKQAVFNIMFRVQHYFRTEWSDTRSL